MESQRMPPSCPLHPKINRNMKISLSWPWARSHLRNRRICFESRISYYTCFCYQRQEQNSLFSRKSYAKMTKKCFAQLREEPTDIARKGSIAGAVALIIGTTIGSGILALPQKASPAGLVPSSISMIICWAFLLIEALVLVEVNVALRRKKKKKEEGKELEVISFRTMAQETLGDWGFFFTVIFTMLISIGGTRVTDQVNQWLTTSMIGLLLAIEVLAVIYGGWSKLEGSGNWGKVPATIPVIIFSLVYHDLAPVLCAYLGGDLTRIRTSILLGSLFPLLALLVWDAVALGLSAPADKVVDPVELLMRVKWSGVSLLVQAFSLLAVGTSLIGTLLGFSEFFKEQLNNFSWQPSSTPKIQRLNDAFNLRKWWGRNKISFMAMTMAVAPSLFVSTTVPDAFSAATDIAGGYCMTMLYGVLPPAMAWKMLNREAEDTESKALSKARPVLFGVGLFACGIVVEQILQDIISFHS
ncbi:tyrosine-specific transport protein 2-like isoform X3 [Carya illinoinensis]|uniref:tyrosine-specific transport protein 2-like isoform X3 n=1 Tax=Carya illinoinensis TaxID=32201 RepID=UPI001C726406|nr:tyrosine-specific transport protein 2-like isoform X3 [Carya illinoinensis]